ncbi:DUF2269 family protein [Metabacillus herbersteinensis]|uniref:DUF2269 family protein n=1 Tax=Metabacillus herbersteinensis TaxID=283816 RepID=A0ABV6GK79_9BACI
MLYFVGNYGAFTQLWFLGSLVCYIIFQIIVICLITPNNKKLSQWVFNEENQSEKELPLLEQSYLSRVNGLFYVASTFGVLLFILMIIKP